jgi:hypothetical protein
MYKTLVAAVHGLKISNYVTDVTKAPLHSGAFQYVVSS